MHLKGRIFKSFAALLGSVLLSLYGAAGYFSLRLPDRLTAEIGEEVVLAEYPEITCASVKYNHDNSCVYPDTQEAMLTLFGAIPIKNIEIHEEEAPTLAVGGFPFGIKLLMDGVMITSLGEFYDISGESVCPARDSGLLVGDIIQLVDMMPVTSNSQLHDIIANSGGRPIKINVNRDGHEFIAYLEPVWSEEHGCWAGGMWVRDSIAGIGTVTFVNVETGDFAGLGHPVCDSDTGSIVTISSGEAVPVEITEVKSGEKGVPGELHGKFVGEPALGSLIRNNECGVFGVLSEAACGELQTSGELYKMAYRQEVRTGKAEILSTISGTVPQRFEIEIESVDYSSTGSKNMVIRITDDELLEASGGIVQGMSGSPIIQDGKLVGAVTHVLVNDPTRGYGIFIENMLEAAK